MKKYVFIICLLMCFCHIKAQETEKESKFKLSFSERVRLTTIDKAITYSSEIPVKYCFFYDCYIPFSRYFPP